jgi:putative transposase
VAFDFFTVPTLTFNLLYCFLVIEDGRRKVLLCNVTPHPTSDWVVQQLRETFPEGGPYRYALFDHDSKFNDQVMNLLRSTGLEPKRTSIQAPWQNGLAERWIGSRPREVLDHIIPLNERHLRRLLHEYMSYTTRTVFTMVSIRMHRTHDYWRTARHQRPLSHRALGSEVSIIATAGA